MANFSKINILNVVCVSSFRFGKHIRRTVQIMLRLSDQNRAIAIRLLDTNVVRKLRQTFLETSTGQVKDEPRSGRPKVR